MTQNLLLPVFFLVLVTFLVWLRLYAERIGEMRARRIPPDAVATARQAAEVLRETKAADNFRNLFELPVLFYVLCLALLQAGVVTPPFVAGSWLFVILRALHSLIHCTYNRVMHRFLVYVASSVVLWLLWLWFAVAILSR
jgi:hypothetical protein